ncbi:MAG: response regulator transcription factor [Planctomycetota bacterium]|nr:response regulator transcription factor [Planctomycetota bacterium]
MELHSSIYIPEPERASSGSTALLDRAPTAPAQRSVAARKTITVVVADQRALHRAALGAWLSADPGIDLLGRATSAEEAAALAVDGQPDALVLACDNAAHPFIALAGRLQRLSPRTRVIVLSSEHAERTCRAAATCGSSAHISELDPPEDLIAALRARPGSAGPTCRCVKLASETPSPRLSPREREVLIHLARGLSAKQAAATLGLCPKTVDNHTQRLMKKLDLHTRADVVLFAVREGYVKP